MSYYTFKGMMNPGTTEFNEQVAVMEWAAQQVNVYAGLNWLFAVPNGEKRERVTRVSRSGKVSTWSPAGVRVKRMGGKKGVPDLMLCWRNSEAYGLVIEMKGPGGTLEPEQKAWLSHYDDERWYAVACWGAEAAIAVLSHYLEDRMESCCAMMYRVLTDTAPTARAGSRAKR